MSAGITSDRGPRGCASGADLTANLQPRHAYGAYREVNAASDNQWRGCGRLFPLRMLLHDAVERPVAS
jgi:hypothetical protein